MPRQPSLADHLGMRKRLAALLFAVVVALSFAAGAGQASANPGHGAGAGNNLTTYGVTWE